MLSKYLLFLELFHDSNYLSFLIHFIMKCNFHNFDRKKPLHFISEIEMHYMFTNEKEKHKNACII